jgi:hypothetical protein
VISRSIASHCENGCAFSVYYFINFLSIYLFKSKFSILNIKEEVLAEISILIQDFFILINFAGNKIFKINQIKS